MGREVYQELQEITQQPNRENQLTQLALAIQHFTRSLEIPEDSHEYDQLIKNAAYHFEDNEGEIAAYTAVASAFEDVLTGRQSDRLKLEHIPPFGSDPERSTTIVYAPNRYVGDDYILTIYHGELRTLDPKSSLDRKKVREYVFTHKRHEFIIPVGFPQDMINTIFRREHTETICSKGGMDPNFQQIRRTPNRDLLN